MIKIYFRDLPKSKELELDFETLSLLANKACFDPSLKSIGADKNEFVGQEIEMQFKDGPVEVLFISGETANYVKKVIKKAL